MIGFAFLLFVVGLFLPSPQQLSKHKTELANKEELIAKLQKEIADLNRESDSKAGTIIHVSQAHVEQIRKLEEKHAAVHAALTKMISEKDTELMLIKELIQVAKERMAYLRGMYDTLKIKALPKTLDAEREWAGTDTHMQQLEALINPRK